MKHENRYLVVKRTDIDRYLIHEEKERLLELHSYIDRDRNRDNKLSLNCVVVEHDWPMFEPTWNAIENWVDGNLTDEKGYYDEEYSYCLKDSEFQKWLGKYKPNRYLGDAKNLPKDTIVFMWHSYLHGTRKEE